MPAGPAASWRQHRPPVGAGSPAPRRQQAGRPRRAWRVRRGRSGGGADAERGAGKSCSAAAGPAAEAGPAEVALRLLPSLSWRSVTPGGTAAGTENASQHGARFAVFLPLSPAKLSLRWQLLVTSWL